jgi:hypothetical protein
LVNSNFKVSFKKEKKSNFKVFNHVQSIQSLIVEYITVRRRPRMYDDAVPLLPAGSATAATGVVLAWTDGAHHLTIQPCLYTSLGITSSDRTFSVLL